MTAVSLFTAGGRAHLLTDRAWYHADGTVLGIQSKVVAADRLRIAVAVNGCTLGTVDEDIAAWLADCRDQREALASAPAIVDAIQSRPFGLAKANGHTAALVQFFIAAFDQERGAPAGFIVGGGGGTLGTGYAPLSVRRVRTVVSPPVDEALYPGGDDFDPVVDGLRLIEAQRFACDEKGVYLVGGGADLTSVGANGIATQQLATWPDRVGQRLDPTAAEPQSRWSGLLRMAGIKRAA